jgi:outer membrane protein assembly factor BamB
VRANPKRLFFAQKNKNKRKEKYMKIFKTKTLFSLIAITLMLTIAFSIAFSPTADAALRDYKDMAYVALAPNTIGAGQDVIITFWCDKLPPTATGDYGDRFYFDVNIIKPDGTNDTITNIESDPVGAGYTTYKPLEPGTYVVQAIMLEHIIDGGASRGKLSPSGIGWWPSGQPNVNVPNPVGIVFESALSQMEILTVTSEPVQRYAETPLPTDYWTRPVYDTNRGWGSAVMGQWLGASELTQYGNNGVYDPYTTGPASSHILWTHPFFNGGLAGGVSTVNGSSSDNSYYSGQSYESYGGPSIILNGKIYYTVGTNPHEGFYCVDLYSGNTIYFRNTTGGVQGAGGMFGSVGSIPNGVPAFGQVLTYDSPNQHGTISYYWVTSTGKSNTWDMYDDFSGNYICSIGNIPSWAQSTGFSFFGPAAAVAAVGTDGSILRYTLANLGTLTSPNWYLQCWNTSQAIMKPSYITSGLTGSNINWMWRPILNNTYDGALGYSANASIPSLTLQAAQLTIRQVIPDDQLVIVYAGTNNGTLIVPGSVINISLKPGSVGTVNYSYNFTSPAGLGNIYGQTEQFMPNDAAYGGVNIQAGIFWYTNPLVREYYIFDLKTGTPLWTAPQAAQFAYYGMGTAIVYKGQFIDCGGYAGVVRAFDARTGDFLWNWTAPSVGLDETAYPYTPTYLGALSGDGQLYLYSNEHSINNPIRRDAMIWDINATNGHELWQLTDWPSAAPILADGRLVVVDSHDEEIYCFGRGDSATTVSAPQIIPALGTSVMLTGTVTDQSQYGHRDINSNIDVALKGTPAIADASMDAWMEYMFHQKAKPTNATGVEVTLSAIDPNGNLVPVGTTTSDMNGNYGLPYTPEVPGTYQIIATFAGSNSYGPSSSTTYLAVGEGPTSTPAPTAAPQSIADMYFVPAIIGVIVAIILVGAVIVLMLRKHP